MAKLKTFQENITLLQALEKKLQQTFAVSKNKSQFMETDRYHRIEDRWDNIMIKVRGYGVTKKFGEKLKPEWVEYCAQNNLEPNYNIGDVMA